MWKGSVCQKISLTQDSQSESLSQLIFYKYSFQVDGRRIFCQSQPFPCSYERLFFVLCQYSLVLADITVVTVVSTESQWENLSHFISQTRLEDSKAKFQTSIFLDAKHETKNYGKLFMTVECIFLQWKDSTFSCSSKLTPIAEKCLQDLTILSFLQSKLGLFFVEMFR